MRALDNLGVPHKYRFEFKKFSGYQEVQPAAPAAARTSADFIPNAYSAK